MAREREYLVYWSDWHGEHEEKVMSITKGRAVYKVFVMLRDEKHIFEPNIQFDLFITHYFKKCVVN